MSYWERPKHVHRARAVDVGEVARAGVALLDQGGLRALTVRAVANAALEELMLADYRHLEQHRWA